MDHVLFYSILDGSVCFYWKCLYKEPRKYCLQDGKIPGAVIYFIEDGLIKNVFGHYHRFHPLGGLKANKKELKA